MNRLLGKLANEWEKTTCWMFAAIMTAFVLTWINLGNDAGTTGSGKKPPKHISLLDRDAFDFMEEMPDSAIGGVNPLCFRYTPAAAARPWRRPGKPSRYGTKRTPRPRPTPAKTPKAKPRTLRPARLKPRPTPKKTAAPTPTKTAAPTPTKTAAPTPAKTAATPIRTPTKGPAKPAPKTVPPAKKKPPQKREIIFCGLMKTLSGKTVAQVQVHDLTTKKKVLDFWTPGAQVQGLKIESITDKTIKISDPSGQTHTISLGGENKKSITFE